MKIAKDAVVLFDFVLTDDDGEEIERGSGDEAMAYLHGHGQIVPGLEAALEGHGPGDQLKVKVAPADAFGEASGDEELTVPRGDLDEDIEIGDTIEGELADGSKESYWVVDIDEKSVHLSPDHPLAGITLNFDVTVRDVRAATPEELEHGHAHVGAGGEDEDEEPEEDAKPDNS